MLAEFPKCSCGCGDTISQLGCAPFKKSGKIPVDAFTSLRQLVVPVEQPMLASVTVACIATFYDVCAKCGMERCTRAQLVQAPVQAQAQAPAQYPQRHGNGGRIPFMRG